MANDRGIDIGTFVVTPKDRDEWPRVVAALTAMWSGEPDFLLGMLRRCEARNRQQDSDPDHADFPDVLLEDLTAERLTRRTGIGHVDPLDATIFLMAAKTAHIDELRDSANYDVSTARYLDAAAYIAGRAPEAQTHDNDSISHQTEFVVLDSALREIGIIEPEQPAPLLENAAAEVGSALLENAIGRLAHRFPDVASVRVRELGYLANVLFAAAQSDGRPLTERVAARLAVATAALGAGHLVLQTQDGTYGQAEQLDEVLRSTPGVIRLFQAGFHLLSLIPHACCRAVYLAKDVQSRRKGHIAYLEMQEILGNSHLMDLLHEGRYGEAKSVIDGLTSAIDSESCVALRILVDPFPAFPLLLSGSDASRAIYVNRRTRPIDRTEDLDRIHDFLAGVARGDALRA